jgi:hypothetical protein
MKVYIKKRLVKRARSLLIGVALKKWSVRIQRTVIIVMLVPESNDVRGGRIVREIIAETVIPWGAKIEKVTVGRNA